MKTRTRTLAAALALLVLAGCSIKVDVKDRHTIMEDEAAGEWPDFEKDLVARSKESGPTPYRKTELNGKKKRIYNVLNGEMTSGSAKP